MKREEILEKIIEIGKDVFDDDNLVLTESSVSADVDGWDSLAYFSLLNEIECEYGISFELADIQRVKTIGELIDRVVYYTENK